jgi:hypothetical protein
VLVDQQRHPEALTDFQMAFATHDDWDAQTRLLAVLAALGMRQRETALAWFDHARGANTGATRGLYAKAEAGLKATRPWWKIWGV